MSGKQNPEIEVLGYGVLNSPDAIIVRVLNVQNVKAQNVKARSVKCAQCLK
jgi:hypothetical protein